MRRLKSTTFKRARTPSLWIGIPLVVMGLVTALLPMLPVFAAEVTIDGTVFTTGNTFDGTAADTVFISDQVGYKFYSDSNIRCGYSKTTDGGATWGSIVYVTVSGGACQHAAAWYDRWTPGNTGTYIELAFMHTSPSEDFSYNRLDTSNDTLLLSSAVMITDASGVNKTNDLRGDDNYQTIAKSTSGKLYMGVMDSGTSGDQSYILECASSCDTPGNWSDSGIAGLPENLDAQARNNPMQLMPQADGDILAIIDDGTNNDILSKRYDAGTDTWDTNWTTIDATATNNTGYGGENISATLDKTNFDVYLTYMGDASTSGTNDDIRTARYSSGSWTAKTDVITNDASRGLVSSHIAINENNGEVYVAYLVLTTPANGSTCRIYWKKSTDGMTTWGTEQGPVNSSTTNKIDGAHLNTMSDERLFGSWTEAATDTTNPRLMKGDTVANIGISYTQAAFRLFDNNNSTDVGTALANQDTAASLVNTGDAFRLRMLIHMSGDTGRINHKNFKLQFAGKGGGTCASPSGTPSTYTDVTTGTAISYNNNASPADGAALTSNANDPTHSGHTVRNQTYEEANDLTNSQAAIATGEDGKWDFALYDNGASASTAYCFRMVEETGTVLDTYSQYPQITTSAGNANPNNPGSLAQKKTNDTVLNTGDWTNEASVKFTASVSDPDSSDTLQLCVEKQPLGTGFNSNAGSETCGTGVAYSGTPVSVNVTIGSHSEGEYHWQARTKDAAGVYSSWVSYDTNLESARDYGVDTSAPTSGTVYDGTSTGVDAAFNDNSLSSLSANWASFNANISGLSKYQYSIGTTPGGTTIKNWTDNGTTTSVTATGLTLQTSQPYYFNVRAVDNAGNTQTAISSDGQLVLPSLSFGISASNITFNNLNAGNSYTDATKETTLTTSTNAYGGYVVRAFATDYLRANALATIPDFTGGTYASPDSWQSGDTGFGYTSTDTSVQGSNKFQNNPCPGGSALASPGCYAPFSQTKPGDIVADHTANVTGTPLSNQQFTVKYRVTADGLQAASNNYATTIVYSVTPIY